MNNNETPPNEPTKAPSRLRKIAFRVGRLLVLTYMAVCVLMFGCQSRLVYYPTKKLESTPKDIGLAYEDISLTASDGVQLHGWFVPAPSPRGAVLICHGNGGNISHRLATLRVLHDMGLSALIFDYRGYGQSKGKPSENGTYLDAEAAWQYLVSEQKFAPDQILVFGRSLGGAIAAHLAKDHKPGALIIDSSFSSIKDLGAEMYPFLPIRLLSRFDYSTLEYVQQIDCPLLVIHSPNDELIPIKHGRRVFEAAKEPKQFLQSTGGHNDRDFLFSIDYRQTLLTFIISNLATVEAE